MSNEEFIVLAAKVAESEATIGELALYNAACDALQNEQATWTDMDADLPVMQAVSLKKFWKDQSDLPKVASLWPRIVIAASVLLVLSIGGYFYFSQSANKQLSHSQWAGKDVTAGRNAATLTLAGGKVINLSNSKTGVIINASKMAYNDGTLISSSPGSSSSLRGETPKQSTTPDNTASSGSNTVILTTPRGGQYQVILPDGTKVWLNAASTLQFPNKFVGTERRVVLVGEAYFEVVHNSERPFRVESKGQLVEDIGTAFNINSYPDENSVNTTLLEGAASVKGVKTELTILKPGQQAVLFGNTIKVTAANVRNAIAWKQGKFVFDDESLASIMRKVARWYDVEIIYKDIDPEKKFGGSMSRFENVSKVLEKLELTESVHFQIEGRKIYVEK